MRNRLLVIFVLVVAGGSAVAQKTEFEFILRPAFGSIRGTLPDHHNMHGDRFVRTTGLGFGTRINTKSSIHASILLNARQVYGETDLYSSDPVTGQNVVYKTNTYLCLSYLTLPLEYRRRFGNKVIFEYGVGVYVGYLLNYLYTHDIPSNLQWVGSYEESELIDFKKGDFGLSASFRASYPLEERIFIYVAIDDHLGLLNVYKEPPTDGLSLPKDQTIRNNSFGISFGLSFLLFP